jgi:hypothetical protein
MKWEGLTEPKINGAMGFWDLHMFNKAWRLLWKVEVPPKIRVFYMASFQLNILCIHATRRGFQFVIHVEHQD